MGQRMHFIIAKKPRKRPGLVIYSLLVFTYSVNFTADKRDAKF